MDDFSTSLLDFANEEVFVPFLVNLGGCGFASDGAAGDIRVHGGRVVAPDGEFLDVSDW